MNVLDQEVTLGRRITIFLGGKDPCVPWSDEFVTYSHEESQRNPQLHGDYADNVIADSEYDRIVLETYAEHTFRRIQRRVTEGVISNTDIRVYYRPLDNDTFIELVMDTYGRIQNWPKGLFGNALEDVGEQMRAMVKRMQKESDA